MIYKDIFWNNAWNNIKNLEQYHCVMEKFVKKLDNPAKNNYALIQSITKPTRANALAQCLLRCLSVSVINKLITSIKNKIKKIKNKSHEIFLTKKKPTEVGLVKNI